MQVFPSSGKTCNQTNLSFNFLPLLNIFVHSLPPGCLIGKEKERMFALGDVLLKGVAPDEGEGQREAGSCKAL